MNNIILDTNILIDFYITNDFNENCLEALQGKKLNIYQGVVDELFSAIKNRYGSKSSYTIAKRLLTDPLYTVIEADSEQKLKALELTLFHQAEDSKKNISLVDAIQIVLAQELDYTLYTRDERMTLFDNVVKPY